MERKRKGNEQSHSETPKKACKSRKTAFNEEDEEEELFSWEDYLKKTCSKAVPQSTFKHVHDPVGQGFVPGMKVEALNRNSEQGNTYWVATIVTVSGPLLLLRYDGYDKDRSGDFWCDAASEDLQPIGWCARTNHVLLPPEAIRHKESNWAKFLSNDLKDKTVHAPEQLFHKPTTEDEEGVLSPGTKVELLNKDDFTSYWVASVVESYGMRLQLRYEGVKDEEHDVWIYYLSERLHELGWGIQHGLVVRPPIALISASQEVAAVSSVMATCHSSVRQTSPLNLKPKNFPREHNLTVGKKLEAIHPEDPSCICVATVSKILSPVFFQVQIDSLISCSDKALLFCSHADARNIFPVGWCESHNITLTPPPGYHAFPFSWERYLEWTCSVAAPKDLFDLTVPEHEFELDLKLEAVDQTNPAVITVATVTQVVGRTVWVHLDGIQDDAVEHIYDAESYDLLPAGWGSTHGHPLQTPKLSFMDKNDNNRLSTLRVTRQRQKQMNGSASETSDNEEKKKSKELQNEEKKKSKELQNEEKKKSKELQNEKKSDSEPDKKQDKTHEDTINKANSNKQNIQLPVNKTKNLQIKKPIEVKIKLPPKKNNTRDEMACRSVSTQSSAKIKPFIPEAKTTLIAPGETKKKQKEEQQVTSSVDLVDLTDEDLPVDKVPEKEKEKAPKHHVCIHMKPSCKAGPFLSQAKLNLLTPCVMGPDTPDIALRKLLECIVKCSHRSRQVLDILSSEREKKTFRSILQTLHIKLQYCPNMFTLRKVLFCSLCDKPNKVPASSSTSKLVNTSSQQKQPTSKPIQSQAEPSSTPTPTTTTMSPSQPVARLLEKTSSSQDMPSIPKPGSTVDRPPKNPVKVSNEPVKVCSKSAGAGTLSSRMDELATPQNPVVSSAAFVVPSGSHISTWNVPDVVEFIKSTECNQYANIFLEQEIDGKALMLLSLDDFHKGLDLTLGPAIKLHNYVQRLCEKPK